MNPQLQELTNMVMKLQTEVTELSSQVNKNSFTSSQTFNKDCIFNSRLKVPSYSAAPTVADVGDLIEIGGKLYICTVASPVTFTLVGSQV